MRLQVKLIALNVGVLLLFGAAMYFERKFFEGEGNQYFFITLGLCVLIGGFFVFLFSRKLSRSLNSIADDVAGGAEGILSTSSQVSKHAERLSNATNSQVSSLQETVASLNEISAMVNKNTEAAQSSKNTSTESRQAAERGKKTVTNMISSVNEISDANTEIIEQMNKNSSEIKEIITVIREIEEKTTVINDIVFQTKLLSFNASVEAARAGEHGKGFSVVAEEVGNLAQHSGDAAKEIEQMLSESVSKVESIAKNTEVKAKELIERGTSKVEQSRQIARDCDQALGQILKNANNLDSIIDDIANASLEQSQGIQEITHAMSELDSMTKQNSVTAHEVSQSTQTLNTQAKSFDGISQSLRTLIVKDAKTEVKTIEETKKNVSKGRLKPKKIETKKAKIKKAEPNKADLKRSIFKKEEPTKKKGNILKFDSKKGNTNSKLNSAPVQEARNSGAKARKSSGQSYGIPDALEGEWEDI